MKPDTKLICELTKCPDCGGRIKRNTQDIGDNTTYTCMLCSKCIKVIGSYTIKYDYRSDLMDKWLDMFGFGNMKCY